MNVKKLSTTVDKTREVEQAISDLKAKEQRRQRNYTEFWRLYRGEHWAPNELDADKPTPFINKCFVFVNKSISFLVGNPPTVNYPTPEAEKILSPYVNKILKNSGGFSRLSWESAQMGSITGDCFLKPVYDPTLTGVRIQVNDSPDVSVRYPFRDYQNNVPSRAEIEWTFIDEADEDKVKTYKEVWTAKQKIVTVDGELVPDESGLNLIGEVPIVHIRNLLIGKEVYGMSDIEQIEPLNKLLNASVRRFMDDVDYNGDPVTLLFGVRINQLEKGEGKMWGNLPVKSKVENLTLETDFPAQQKFIEYMDEACYEVGSIVKSSVTGNTAISNTSGVALHMNNLPIIELTDRKKVTYGPGFEQAIRMALMLELLVELKKEATSRISPEEKALRNIPDDEYIPSGIISATKEVIKLYALSSNPSLRGKQWNEVEVQFQDYLPKDRLVEMQIIKDELSMGLESRKGAMKRLGKDNIDAVLVEIASDLETGVNEKLKILYGSPSGNTTQGMRGAEDTSQGAARQIKGGTQ